MNNNLIKKFYVIAGVYDGILGLAFLMFPVKIFSYCEVTPPNHMAYVQFPAMLLIVFSGMFFKIASDPVKYRLFIPAGCGLKISYCSMAFYYQITSTIPSMWIPWAWIDLLFLILFILSWKQIGQLSSSTN